MRRWLPFLILLLGACDAAGPGFRGIPGIEREYDGSKFTLRRNGDVVEAIRTSPEWLPKFPDVSAKAAHLAHMETGCDPVWVDGDESMMRVGLKCEGRKAPKRPRKRRSIFCEIGDLWRSGESISGYMTCG